MLSKTGHMIEAPQNDSVLRSNERAICVQSDTLCGKKPWHRLLWMLSQPDTPTRSGED
jgi:hypothetical protein